MTRETTARDAGAVSCFAMIDTGVLDSIAEDALQRADADPEAPPTVFELAAALGYVVERPAHMVTLGATSRLHGRVRIAVKASVVDERSGHIAGHEMGHVLMREHGIPIDEFEELRADYLGGALMIPHAYALRLYRAEGFAPALLAEEICCTQTAASLRIAEVVGVALAAVSPAIVRVRGPVSFVWGDEQSLRREAAARRPRPGLARVRLTDERGRVALLPDEDREPESDVG